MIKCDAFACFKPLNHFCIQAPAKDCHCKPLIRKLENKLKATEMEMKLQIHTVQEEMNSRLGKVELKNKKQVCLVFTIFKLYSLYTFIQSSQIDSLLKYLFVKKNV